MSAHNLTELKLPPALRSADETASTSTTGVKSPPLGSAVPGAPQQQPTHAASTSNGSDDGARRGSAASAANLISEASNSMSENPMMMSPSRRNRPRGASVTFSGGAAEHLAQPSVVNTPVRRRQHSELQQQLSEDYKKFMGDLHIEHLGATQLAFSSPPLLAVVSVINLLRRNAAGEYKNNGLQQQNGANNNVHGQQAHVSSVPIHLSGSLSEVQAKHTHQLNASASSPSPPSNRSISPGGGSFLITTLDDITVSAQIPLALADQPLFTVFDMFDLARNAVDAMKRKLLNELSMGLQVDLIPFDVVYGDDPRTPEEARLARRQTFIDKPTFMKLIFTHLDPHAMLTCVVDDRAIFESLQLAEEAKMPDVPPEDDIAADDLCSPGAQGSMAMSFTGNPGALLRAAKQAVYAVVGTTSVAIVLGCSPDVQRVDIALMRVSGNRACKVLDVTIDALYHAVSSVSPLNGRPHGLVIYSNPPAMGSSGTGSSGLISPMTPKHGPQVPEGLPPPSPSLAAPPASASAAPLNLKSMTRRHSAPTWDTLSPNATLSLIADINASSACTHLTAVSLALDIITKGKLPSLLDIGPVVRKAKLGVEMLGSGGVPSVQQVYSYTTTAIKAINADHNDDDKYVRLRTAFKPIEKLGTRPDAPLTTGLQELQELLRVCQATNKDGALIALCMCIDIDLARHTVGGAFSRTAYFAEPPADQHYVVFAGYDAELDEVSLIDTAPRFFGAQWRCDTSDLLRALTHRGIIAIGRALTRTDEAFQLVSSEDHDLTPRLPHYVALAMQAGTLHPPIVGGAPLSLAIMAMNSIKRDPSRSPVQIMDFFHAIPERLSYTMLQADMGMPDLARCVRHAAETLGVKISCDSAHFSIVDRERRTRRVELSDFDDWLTTAAKAPWENQVILNYNPRKIAALTSEKRCHATKTSDFAIFLGFNPASSNTQRMAICCDTNPNLCQRVWAAPVRDLYEACADVCPLTGRTMGAIAITAEPTDPPVNTTGWVPLVPSLSSFSLQHMKPFAAVGCASIAAVALAFTSFGYTVTVEDVLFAYVRSSSKPANIAAAISAAATVEDLGQISMKPRLTMATLRTKTLKLDDLRELAERSALELGFPIAVRLGEKTEADLRNTLVEAAQRSKSTPAQREHILVAYGTKTMHNSTVDSHSYAIVTACAPDFAQVKCVEVEAGSWVDSWVQPLSLVAESLAARDAPRLAKRGIVVFTEQPAK